MGVYAVIQTGGKQYRVSPGDTLKVEKLAAKPGETVTINDVHLIVNGDKVSAGRAALTSARVKAEVVGEGRGEKIVVFKFKRRKHYRKTRGHRQHFTEIRIKEISLGDTTLKADNTAKQAPVAKPTQKKKKIKRVTAQKAKTAPPIKQPPAPAVVVPTPPPQVKARPEPDPVPASPEPPAEIRKPAQSAPTPVAVTGGQQTDTEREKRKRWLLYAGLAAALLALLALFGLLRKPATDGSGDQSPLADVEIKKPTEDADIKEPAPIATPSEPFQPPK